MPSRQVFRCILLAVLVVCLPSCAKLRRRAKPTRDASAPNASVAVATPDAAASGEVPSPAAIASARVVKDRARAEQWLADLRWRIDHKITTKPGEGDAVSTCDAIENARSKLGADGDPEYASILDEAAGLCAFDIPLITASEALDQLRFYPSQASRLLSCSVAAREIARARAVRPKDPRVRKLDARRITACG